MLLNVRCVLFPFTIVAFISATLSHFTLDRQCWHERTLFTVNLHSNLDRTQEDAVTIQSNSKQDNFSPWSYPPTCTPFLPSLNSTLCIYTSTTFASGRGISIFTTPALASHYASLPAFLQPSLLTAQHINTHTATWRTQSLPGKGTGVLATRPLHYRDTITAYTPAFLAVLESELSTQDREVYWRQAILQLPETIRDRFLALSTVYGDERVKVQDVVKANTFQLDIQGVNHLAVWPETSRLNHACAPNAQYVIDPELLTHHVRATRDIAEGEEITIAYTSPLAPISQRAAHLSSFHFTCTCPRCMDPTSDAKLAAMQTLQAQLNDWTPSSPATPALAQRLVQMYRAEGLEGFLDAPFGFVALAWSAVGEAGKAREYAVRAARAVEMKDGVDRGKVWREMWERRGVEGHWSWRRRVGR